MVNLWPWRSSSSSTATFEKTLSTLSAKITTTQSKLEAVRASARRVKLLATLILIVVYLFYAVVLFLVIGYRNGGPYHWAILAGGPIVIYTTRTLLAAVYNYRIDTLSARLKEYQQDRAKTIQKLKDATKYDSTAELIEKYGGEAKKKDTEKQSAGKDGAAGGRKADGKRQSMPGRTGLGPPPTANIPRRQSSLMARPETPQRTGTAPTGWSPSPSGDMEPGAEFAPNAEFAAPGSPQSTHGQNFSPTPQHFATFPSASPAPPAHLQSNWYDRIFDVLLGEDETAPKNRIVLICKRCRLVNGQAPPGTKTLGDVGLWRCMSCGVINGEEKAPEDEGKRLIREVLETRETGKDDEGEKVDEEEDDEEEEMVEVNKEDGVEGDSVTTGLEDGPAASVKRRRGKANT